jgi:hypothetical protein
VHLRLARLANLDEIADFCSQHRDEQFARDCAPAEVSALLRRNIDTVVMALREHTLMGVALCSVSHGKAHLFGLAVASGPDHASIERRLLRRTLGNVRALGLGSLDFSAADGRRLLWSLPDVPT